MHSGKKWRSALWLNAMHSGKSVELYILLKSWLCCCSLRSNDQTASHGNDESCFLESLTSSFQVCVLQSAPISILVPLWFISICLVFFYLCKLLFSMYYLSSLKKVLLHMVKITQKPNWATLTWWQKTRKPMATLGTTQISLCLFTNHIVLNNVNTVSSAK